MANYLPYPYGGYPPMQMQMPQMPPQMPQTGQMAGGGLSPMSRPVSSKEEAQACAADFSGALMVFPDLAHGHVYLKRWNLQSGAADFVDFVPAMDVKPPVEQPVPEYVCLQTYQADMEALQRQLAELKGVISGGE